MRKKSIKCAEVLVPYHIPYAYVTCAAVIHESVAQKLKEIFAMPQNKKTVVADKAGFSSTTVIYDWINENTTPNIHSIIVLAKALDCTVDYLFDRE